ncbi:hypothetical protein I4F81_007560 [Pyropia yezoensis]|uniref:Uncharacterized protein n=1 Tax=Pyropia yezoensis TaxID=2788 RepID=A0ACC3C3X1_PYRYE|nr:hypothetical protein I4F81_007560 [Neopyropia yezoensis]
MLGAEEDAGRQRAHRARSAWSPRVITDQWRRRGRANEHAGGGAALSPRPPPGAARVRRRPSLAAVRFDEPRPARVPRPPRTAKALRLGRRRHGGGSVPMAPRRHPPPPPKRIPRAAGWRSAATAVATGTVWRPLPPPPRPQTPPIPPCPPISGQGGWGGADCLHAKQPPRPPCRRGEGVPGPRGAPSSYPPPACLRKKNTIATTPSFAAPSPKRGGGGRHRPTKEEGERRKLPADGRLPDPHAPPSTRRRPRAIAATAEWGPRAVKRELGALPAGAW